MPYLAGCEVHDNPYAPICRRCRNEVEKMGDAAPIAYLTPDERYVEKLATPDVTIADLIGDIDPIKAARGGHELSSEMTVHYGLLPRANRGIFAINELPDLAGKIQVGLFNIMQEGDVQIKGYPICRSTLPLCLARTRRITRRAVKSLRRSKTASDRRFARTIRRPWKKALRLQLRKRGPNVTAKARVCSACIFPTTCRK
jgi:hypothetical protein